MPENLEEELLKRQKLYQDIFLKAKNELEKKLKTFTTLQEQKHFLENELSRDILKRIEYFRYCIKNYECVRCGTCCKVANSEFTHEELLKKATNKDKFAESFVSVFVPYEDKTLVEKEFQEYTDLLKKNDLFNQSNFFHCPKVKEENGCYSCSDYENRPMVCRDFPNNPLVILPPKCSFRAWKDEFEVEALFLNAMIDLVGYYLNKGKKNDI